MNDILKWIGIYLGVGFFLNFMITLLYLKEFVEFSVSQMMHESSIGGITQEQLNQKVSTILSRPRSVAFTFSVFISPLFFLVLIPALFGKNPFPAKNS